MRLRLGRRTAVIAGSSALVLAAGGAAAYAATSSGPVDSSGAIHGCYSSRAIRGSHVFELQDSGTSCPRGTTAISWSQAASSAPRTLSNSHVVQAGVDLPPGQTAFARAMCPSGEVATGGGYADAGSPGQVSVEFNTGANNGLSPDQAVGWDVEASNLGGTDVHLNAFAYCAQVSG